MNPIIVIGTGGHSKSIIDIIESTNEFKIEGLISESKYNINKKILGYEIIGSDEDLPLIRKSCANAVIGIGHLGKTKKRMEITKLLTKLEFNLPIIYSKYSIISSHSKVEEGTVVGHGAIINAGALVGSNCIINSNSLIEHDCKIGSQTHISTGVLINGGVTIGDNSFIGSGSIIREGLHLPTNCIISSGKRIMGWPLI